MVLMSSQKNNIKVIVLIIFVIVYYLKNVFRFNQNTIERKNRESSLNKNRELKKDLHNLI